MKIQKYDLEYGEFTIKMSFLELYMLCSAIEKYWSEFEEVKEKHDLETAIDYLLSHYGSGWKTPKWYNQTIIDEAFDKLTEDMGDMGVLINEIMKHGLIE